MDKNTKRILSGILALWLMGNTSYDHKVFNNYEIISEASYYANYSNGRVYIGSEEFIKSLSDTNDTDVLIIDNRHLKDSNMQILSSYKITNTNIQNEILEILSHYEKENPSSWNRSFESMKLEWFVHNILYYLNYKTERTRDVDFNNEDEHVYKKKLTRE